MKIRSCCNKIFLCYLSSAHNLGDLNLTHGNRQGNSYAELTMGLCNQNDISDCRAFSLLQCASRIDLYKLGNVNQSEYEPE